MRETSEVSRDERLELITRLQENAGVASAILEVEEQRDAYLRNLARKLHVGTDPVDQREIDYKRGFWRGALWSLQTLPKKAQLDLQAEIEKAIAEKEGEDAGR